MNIVSIFWVMYVMRLLVDPTYYFQSFSSFLTTELIIAACIAVISLFLYRAFPAFLLINKNKMKNRTDESLYGFILAEVEFFVLFICRDFIFILKR